MTALVLLTLLAFDSRPLAPARNGTACDAAALASSPASKSEQPLSADRPDLTDSADVVGRGRWQVESGLSYERDREDDRSQRQIAAPLAMVRFGVADRVEVRFSTDGVVSEAVTIGGSRTRTTGGSDIQIDAKWRLFDRPRRCVVMALEPVLSLPAGSAAFTSGGYDPTIKVIVDRTLPRGLSLSANVVISSITSERERVTERAVSASLSYPAMLGWNGFAEVYGGSSPGFGSSWIADAGFSHQLGLGAAVDVIVGRGLSAAAADWFVGVGVAVRGVPRARACCSGGAVRDVIGNRGRR